MLSVISYSLNNTAFLNLVKIQWHKLNKFLGKFEYLAYVVIRN